MSHPLIQRAAAACLSVFVTLAMLGGIGHLSARDDAASPQWAKQPVPTPQLRA